MHILDPPRNVLKEIGAYEECIHHPTSTIEPDKSELIRKSNALRDMICKRKTEEENPGGQSKNVTKCLNIYRVNGRRRWWSKK